MRSSLYFSSISFSVKGGNQSWPNKSDGTIKSGVAGQKWACRTKGNCLKKEKEFTRLPRPVEPAGAGICPGEKVEKSYMFRWPEWQKETLADLFRRPKASSLSITSCSGPELEGRLPEAARSFPIISTPSVVHLAARDVRLTVVFPRSARRRSKPFKKRMGWRFHWGFIEFHRLQLRLPGCP